MLFQCNHYSMSKELPHLLKLHTVLGTTEMKTGWLMMLMVGIDTP